MLVAGALVAAPVSQAADGTPPRMVRAEMRDSNGDGKADRVVLTYSERVRHSQDTDGRYPFTVSTYRVIKVGGASGRTLTVFLKEKQSPDGTAKPSVSYSRTSSKPVRDLAGNQAAKQTYADTFPLLAAYASPAGNDANIGIRTSPKRTVGAAITRAGELGAVDVYLAAGSYSGPVTLASGLSIVGGFNAAFERASGAAGRPTITGDFDSATGQFLTIRADNLALPARLVRLELVGPDAVGAGKTSYVVHVRDSTLTITGSRLFTGDGAVGADGVSGASASQDPAESGDTGGNGEEFSTPCNNSSRGTAGPAGVNAAVAGTDGGSGGGGGTMDTDCNVFSLDLDATPGLVGSDAATAQAGLFGMGGGGGPANCGTPGGDGLPGRVSDGSGGLGGDGSAISAGFWVADSGSDGTIGLHGTGGGGGGGGGGCDDGTDAYGAGGGGGGAGGARAPSAGQGGSGGGASFTIFAVNATLTVTGSRLVGGVGGDGGDGGAGGLGQPGGAGGPGGSHPGSPPAGSGGDGGHGGHSGGGGGGAGGFSFLIYSFGSIVTQTGNSFTLGIPGAGGPAGASTGQSGSAGVSGAHGSVGVCASLSGC